jgi:hypothetical protein
LQLPLFILPLPLQCPLLYLRPSHKLPPTKFVFRRLPLPLQLLLRNINHSQKNCIWYSRPRPLLQSFPPFCCCYKAPLKNYNISMDPNFSHRQTIKNQGNSIQIQSLQFLWKNWRDDGARTNENSAEFSLDPQRACKQTGLAMSEWSSLQSLLVWWPKWIPNLKP